MAWKKGERVRLTTEFLNTYNDGREDGSYVHTVNDDMRSNSGKIGIVVNDEDHDPMVNFGEVHNAFYFYPDETLVRVADEVSA